MVHEVQIEPLLGFDLNRRCLFSIPNRGRLRGGGLVSAPGPGALPLPLIDIVNVMTIL